MKYIQQYEELCMQFARNFTALNLEVGSFVWDNTVQVLKTIAERFVDFFKSTIEYLQKHQDGVEVEQIKEKIGDIEKLEEQAKMMDEIAKSEEPTNILRYITEDISYDLSGLYDYLEKNNLHPEKTILSFPIDDITYFIAVPATAYNEFIQAKEAFDREQLQKQAKEERMLYQNILLSDTLVKEAQKYLLQNTDTISTLAAEKIAEELSQILIEENPINALNSSKRILDSQNASLHLTESAKWNMLVHLQKTIAEEIQYADMHEATPLTDEERQYLHKRAEYLDNVYSQALIHLNQIDIVKESLDKTIEKEILNPQRTDEKEIINALDNRETAHEEEIEFITREFTDTEPIIPEMDDSQLKEYIDSMSIDNIEIEGQEYFDKFI